MNEAITMTREQLTKKYKAEYPETKKRYELFTQRIAEREEWIRDHPGHEDAPKIRNDIEELKAAQAAMVKNLIELVDLLFAS